MKKTVLACCLAAASYGAQAELTPMSEFELHSVTGQAGVDIELDVAVNIGEIRYTDTAENGDGDGGSLVVEDIFIGGGVGRSKLLGQPGPNNTSRLDGLKFSVDLGSDGDLNIIGSPVSGTGGIGIVDFLVTTGAVALEGATPDTRHVLVDSVSIYGGALSLQMLIDGPTNDIRFVTSVGIDDMDIDMSSGFGIVIEDMVVAGPNYSIFIEEGLNPSPESRVFGLDVRMDADAVEDGVLFDLRTRLPNYNIFDIDIAKLSVGGDMMGSVFIDDLSLRGLSFVVSGH
ncbi:MAG: DUF6160 family protein [Thalassolituus sp.]